MEVGLAVQRFCSTSRWLHQCRAKRRTWRNFLQRMVNLWFLPNWKKSVEHGGRIAHAYLFWRRRRTGKHRDEFVAGETSLLLRMFTQSWTWRSCSNCLRIAQGSNPDVLMVGTRWTDDRSRSNWSIARRIFTRVASWKSPKIFILSQSEKWIQAQQIVYWKKFLQEEPVKFLSDFRNGKCWTDLADDPVRCQIIHFSPLAKSKNCRQSCKKKDFRSEGSRLWSYLTNSYHKAVEISQEEWFNETRDAVAQWVKYLLKKYPQAFGFVQKKLLALAKERNSRFIFRFG